MLRRLEMGVLIGFIFGTWFGITLVALLSANGRDDE